ncbi:cobalt-precorrin-6A synthase [Marinomonas sp. SBI22]|uniref:cobalt-precorrin-5B (C(1))-methyltransferase n=1 Tax=unclassified Marinomonas TaxID=196814 RepID=UPI0007AF4780|nr:MULTISPECIES: cobalt-precorrin-5B (C(1))-methyltransferase [unclassified Marinomonas]KZM44317.1 cobalt-precorrin-6A synthase [Marinomonas sp. SBI22]KZM45475.1 cobalt-precorrin-6A synthase [Marinomonas sp. SBI8L]
MWPESSEKVQTLRTGLTTGCCATACCVAAAQALLVKPDNLARKVEVNLPKGQLVSLDILAYQVLNEGIRVSTIKDAGDDPDATHGATIFVELTLTAKKGITFLAGEGVGTVTKTGLVLAIGEPAINPVPRKMMQEHLQTLAEELGYQGGFQVKVGVENGEQIALKTMNPRLGILGGLSILGTTGIVRPFSCAAYIASIHQGIDVARANGFTHLAATTGNASEAAIKAHYQLDETALIEMGDFVGALLKHTRKLEKTKKGLTKLSICGGFGKLTKLANGHMDLNSRVSSIDFEQLAQIAAEQGATETLLTKIRSANTSIEALKHCNESDIDLAAFVCEKALTFCRHYIPYHIELEVWAINRKGEFIASAKEAATR